MARDIEADAKINDKSDEGLRKFENNVRKTGKNVEKEFDRFGKSSGSNLLKSIEKVSPKLAETIASTISSAAGTGGPLLVAGVAASLPVLSGLIGAAVTGGAAGAGILGGVALATRDPRVKEAGTTLGQNLLANLSTQASGFIAPVLTVIDQVGDRFEKNGERIQRIFDNSAKFVLPLADAVLDIGDNLINGLDTAIGRAGPVISGLTGGLRSVGDAVESLLDDLSENAEFNGQVLRDTFEGLSFIIESTGRSLKFLGDVFGFIDKVIPISPLTRYSQLLEGTEAKSSATAAAQGVLGRQANQAGAAAEAAEKDTQLYNRALQDNANAALAASQANASLFSDLTRVGAAQDAAAASAKKNGRTLSENTEKGRANRQSLSELASSYNGYRANLEKAGRSTSTVNGVLSTQRSRLIDAARSMGATKTQAAALADQLLGIKPRSAKVTVTGTAAAAANARNVREEIAKVRSKTVSITILTPGLTRAREAANLRRELLLNAEGGGSFQNAGAGGLGRTGGPAFSVEATLQNQIFLDGKPFYAFTTGAIRSDRKRQAFRNRVGRRVSQ